MADGTYHTKAEVAAKFKSVTFGTHGKVTDTELEAEIARTEGYVEGKIDPFYVFASITLADQPKSFAIVKEICLYLTVAKINDILRKNGVELLDKEELAKIPSGRGYAEKMLKGITQYITLGNVEGALKLPDATARALSTGNPAGISSSTSSPTFLKDTEQW